MTHADRRQFLEVFAATGLSSPLPLHFDPRPPDIALAAPPPALIRIEPPPAVRLPPNREALAFWPVTHLAHLLRTRAITSTVLTTMYLERFKRYNAQINCVVSL